MADYFKPMMCSGLPTRKAGAVECARRELIGHVCGVAGLEWAPMHGVEVISRHADSITYNHLSLSDALEQYPEEMRALTIPRLPLDGLGFDRPLIMGILNVTPDSFSDGGRFSAVDSALERALQMVSEGAAIIDIGGESTRPGAQSIEVEIEVERVVPVIKALRAQSDVPISIDTRKAAVMQAALEAGASMINDVSALSFDKDAMAVAAQADVPVVLMHSAGDPQTMQDNPSYDCVELDVFDYLKARVEHAVAAGLRLENIIIDPGIGFGKTLNHNCALLNNLSLLHGIGVPLLLGCSRKSFIGKLSNDAPVEMRLAGSLAAMLNGVIQGVQIMRVHDVWETRQALDVWFQGAA